MTALPAIGFLTEPQRRRAQVLAVVVALFPVASVGVQMRLAHWVTTGRWEGS